MFTVTSADGTSIAFERLGDGAPVILVGGAFCDRTSTLPLAEALAGFSVISYDRRGRGDSGDHAPYAVEREVEDLAALLAAAGGSAAVYGHSSGAGLALRAAAAGLPMSALVLHEPPFGPDTEESRRDAKEFATTLAAIIANDHRADAVLHFLSSAGMPPEAASAMAADPRVLTIAHTLRYELEVMGHFDRGGAIPTDEAATIQTQTLVLCGGASPAFFMDTARRLADLLPHARLEILDGENHAVAPEVLVPVLTEFFRGM